MTSLPEQLSGFESTSVVREGDEQNAIPLAERSQEESITPRREN